jgi:hypothetical protein
LYFSITFCTGTTSESSKAHSPNAAVRLSFFDTGIALLPEDDALAEPVLLVVVVEPFSPNTPVSITGNPDDYAVEVASGAWFGSLAWPGAVGLIIGGPVGLAAGVAVGGIMAYEFEKHVWQKVLEVIKNQSATQPTLDSIEHHG